MTDGPVFSQEERYLVAMGMHAGSINGGFRVVEPLRSWRELPAQEKTRWKKEANLFCNALEKEGRATLARRAKEAKQKGKKK